MHGKGLLATRLTVSIIYSTGLWICIRKTLAHEANILKLKLNKTFVKFCISCILWVFRPNIANKFDNKGE